jgi:hypothetical protein
MKPVIKALLLVALGMFFVTLLQLAAIEDCGIHNELPCTQNTALTR